jgi:mRNA-degrading endonuclease RelE of RelBE toxin-antitoxin system
LFEEATQFLYQYKNNQLEAKDVSKLKDEFDKYKNEIINSEYYDKFFDNYLNIKGYTYRLEKSDLRLFYTFQEAIYSVDLAKLTRDEEGVLLNTVVYILVLSDCIDEYLGNNIDENLKQKALEFYQNEQKRISAENKKYHMYQN